MAYDVGMVMRRHDCYGHCRDTTMGTAMDTIGTLLWTLDSWVVCKLIPTNWTHSPTLSLSMDGDDDADGEESDYGEK